MACRVTDIITFIGKSKAWNSMHCALDEQIFMGKLLKWMYLMIKCSWEIAKVHCDAQHQSNSLFIPKCYLDKQKHDQIYFISNYPIQYNAFGADFSQLTT